MSICDSDDLPPSVIYASTVLQLTPLGFSFFLNVIWEFCGAVNEGKRKIDDPSEVLIESARYGKLLLMIVQESPRQKMTDQAGAPYATMATDALLFRCGAFLLLVEDSVSVTGEGGGSVHTHRADCANGGPIA